MKATRSCTTSARASGSTTSRASSSTAARSQRYIAELSVTGLTSNPTIFDHAIKNSAALRRRDPRRARAGQVRRSALLRARPRGPDARRGPVPPDPRQDLRRRRLGVARGVAAAGARHRRARSPPRRSFRRAPRGRTSTSRFPGTREGVPAIEEAIFAGVPVNVTLLFSREQYVAAAEAYLRGIERRIEAGLRPDVALGRFALRQPLGRRGRGQGSRRAHQPARHRDRTAHVQGVPRLLASPRWQRVENAGARPQRLLWASTGTKDPEGFGHLYIKALAAPFTVNTMPEETLQGIRRSRRGAATLCAPTAATAKPCWRRSRRRHRRRRPGGAAPGRRGGSRSSPRGTS